MKVFPSKHTRLSESCYRIGGLLLNLHEEGDDVDSLFEKYQAYVTQNDLATYDIVNDYYLTIVYLYAVDAIKIDNEITIKV